MTNNEMVEEFAYFLLYKENCKAQDKFESGMSTFKIKCKGDGTPEDFELFKKTHKKFTELVDSVFPATESKFQEYKGEKPDITFDLPPRFRGKEC